MYTVCTNTCELWNKPNIQSNQILSETFLLNVNEKKKNNVKFKSEKQKRSIDYIQTKSWKIAYKPKFD